MEFARSNYLKKASRRIFVIRNLKRAGCSRDVLYSAYVAFIISVLLYCFPVFCNAPAYLFAVIERVERRVFRLLGGDTNEFLSIRDFSKRTCERLFENVEKDVHHPLRPLFMFRAPTHRNPSLLKLSSARTVRFKNSFIRFGV